MQSRRSVYDVREHHELTERQLRATPGTPCHRPTRSAPALSSDATSSAEAAPQILTSIRCHNPNMAAMRLRWISDVPE